MNDKEPIEAVKWFDRVGNMQSVQQINAQSNKLSLAALIRLSWDENLLFDLTVNSSHTKSEKENENNYRKKAMKKEKSSDFTFQHRDFYALHPKKQLMVLQTSFSVRFNHISCGAVFYFNNFSRKGFSRLCFSPWSFLTALLWKSFFINIKVKSVLRWMLPWKILSDSIISN